MINYTTEEQYGTVPEKLTKENIFLNLDLYSKQELQHVYNLLDNNDEDLSESLYDMFKILKVIKQIPYMCYNKYSKTWFLYPNTINLRRTRTEVNFQHFKKIMGANETRTDEKGWIKIESEKDLPKEQNYYFTMRRDGTKIEITFFFFELEKEFMRIATHYKPILFPKPPTN